MSITIERFAGPDTEWDTFVRSATGWTHFHLYGWQTVIRRVFGHECVYLAAREVSGQLSAVLPLVRVRSVLFGHYLVSMPFVNYGGPLGSEAGIRALVAEAVALAARDRVKLLELRSRTPLPIDLPASHRKITVVLDLDRPPAALLASFPGKLRSQIKRPRRDGVEVRFGRAELDSFHQVLAHHMRDLGTPVQPKALFEAIADVFPEDVSFAVAYHDGQPIACGCGFLWNGEFEITWASALRSYSAMSPNMLVYWALMERMAAAGAQRFNFGRCSPDSGTHRYKRQWGGHDEPLWWYQATGRSAALPLATTPSPDGGAFALAARLWQRLPVPIATRLGPAIVRFIP
jgi:serine/alanine adding enzyme